MTDDGNDLRKRKRRVKAGDIEALRRLLWETTLEVEKVLMEPDVDQKLKAASTIATLSGVYIKAFQVGELEARVAALEAAGKEDDDDLD